MRAIVVVSLCVLGFTAGSVGTEQARLPLRKGNKSNSTYVF